MKRMYEVYICLTFLSMLSCRKDCDPPDDATSAEQLLTEKPWKLNAFGYDHNLNGLIDGNEDNIRDCEKDNTYFFHSGGSGAAVDNELVCDDRNITGSFTWTLADNGTTLDFFFATAHVEELQSSRMTLVYRDKDPAPLIVIYTR